MTESEWLTAADPRAMLDFLAARGDGSPGDRKLRLFACACARQAWQLLGDERSRRAVETAERFADGLATTNELAAAWDAAWDATLGGTRGAASLAASAAARADVWAGAWSAARAAQADLLRDVVGNPWRPVASVREAFKAGVASHAEWERLADRFPGGRVEPRWLTPAALAVARAAYDERDPASGVLDPVNLAVLADALGDAGCANDNVLDHLRDPAPHVRGCWALDLVLGRDGAWVARRRWR